MKVDVKRYCKRGGRKSFWDLRNGNSKIDDNGTVRPEFKDQLFVSASNKQRPQVVAPRIHEGKFVTITEEGSWHGQHGIDVTDSLGYKLTAPYRGAATLT